MSILDATLQYPPLAAKPTGPVAPPGLEPIYSQRVGFKICQSGFQTTPSRERYQVSWPSGRLCLYRDCLTVGSLLRTYRIDYSCIERIAPSMLFYARIDHTSPDVPDLVLLNGWFLLRALQRVVRANHLRLAVG